MDRNLVTRLEGLIDLRDHMLNDNREHDEFEQGYYKGYAQGLQIAIQSITSWMDDQISENKQIENSFDKLHKKG